MQRILKYNIALLDAMVENTDPTFLETKKFVETDEAAKEKLLEEFRTLHTNGKIWIDTYKSRRDAASKCKKVAVKRDEEIRRMQMHRVPVSEQIKDQLYREFVEALKTEFGFEQDGFI